jgi:hypothetical protein
VQLSKALRNLSVLGALALAAAVVVQLPTLIRAFGPAPNTSILEGPKGIWTWGNLAVLLSELGNIAAMLPLIALSNCVEGEPRPKESLSKPLRVVATVVAVAWGLWVAFLALRLILTPYTYYVIRQYASKYASNLVRTPPSFLEVASEAAEVLLMQFGLWVAPFVVWRSSRSSGGRSIGA